nr:unnamed protein product [Callosobruchus analis]
MRDFPRIVLLGLALLSLTAVCIGNCSFHYDDDGLSPDIEMQIRQGSENCNSSKFLNITCTFKDNFKSYLEDILNNTVSICSTDKLRLFITKPLGIVSIADLPESLLETNISISHLYLDRLGLKGISRGFFDPQESLEVINLSKNNLDWFSGTIFDKLANLKALDLSENKLYSFNPGESGSLQTLEILNLSFNRFADITESTFYGLDNLRELYLNGNRMYHVRTLLFQNLTNLVVLDLSDNSLESLDFGTFDNLKDLTTLNLSYNRFETLPLYTLHATKSLENLYFSHNPLSDLLDFEVFDTWKLERVDFRGNSLSCMYLVGLIDYLEERNIYFEKETYTEGDNVQGFRCGNLYKSEYEVMSSIRDPYLLNYISTAVKDMSNTLNKALKKLDEVSAKLGHSDT